MKKELLLFVILCCSFMWAAAQLEVELYPNTPVHTKTRLLDCSKEKDDFLLTLPLTFSITDKNVLVIMVGNDGVLDYGYSVWFFSKEIVFSDLLIIDKNVSPPWSSAWEKFNKLLPSHKKITLYRDFDNGYEIVTINAKPIFLELLNPIPGEPLLFSLQFYVSRPPISNNGKPYTFMAKCKPIEIELLIKNKN